MSARARRVTHYAVPASRQPPLDPSEGRGANRPLIGMSGRGRALPPSPHSAPKVSVTRRLPSRVVVEGPCNLGTLREPANAYPPRAGAFLLSAVDKRHEVSPVTLRV